jgi:hypothetical protein
MTTAAARMPKAIHPHCVVLLDASLFDAAAAPAAAAAAGLRPAVVVVVAVVVTVLVTVGETAVWVTAGAVCVTAGAVCVTTTVLVTGAASAVSVSILVDTGCVVVAGVDRVGVENVGAVRVADVLVAVAAVLPPPHDVSATAASTPSVPAPRSLEPAVSAVTARV